VIHFRFQKLHPKPLFFKRAFLRLKPTTLEIYYLLFTTCYSLAWNHSFLLQVQPRGRELHFTNSCFSYAYRGENQPWAEAVNKLRFGDSVAVAPVLWQGCWPEGPCKHRTPPGMPSDWTTPFRTVSRSWLCNGGEMTWKSNNEA